MSVTAALRRSIWHIGLVAALGLPGTDAIAQTNHPAVEANEPDQGAGTVAAQGPERSGRSFLRDIVGDAGALFTSTPDLLLLAGGLGVSAAVYPADRTVAANAFGARPRDGGTVDRFFEAGDRVGSWEIQVGGPLMLYGLGALSRKPEAARLGRDLLRAQLVAAGITQTIKRSVRRLRPDGVGETSFPSGHTSATFATATVLHRRYGWKAGAAAYTVATWVAMSRVHEQRHWLSDLPFGAMIGIAVGRIATREPRRWTVTPLLLRGGAGVQISMLPRVRPRTARGDRS